MKYNKTIAFLMSVFFGLSGVVPVLVSAQTIAQPAPAQICVDLGLNLRFGSDDSTTGGLVTALQNFLVNRGLFNASNLGTGHFGPITLAAATQFQASQGLPTTGFVGPMTRASMKQITCGITSSPASLYSLSPSSGMVGSSVNLTGFGFTASNTILFDGSLVARNVPITSSIAIACTTDPACRGGIRQTLNFTVPSSLAPNCPIGSMCPMYMRLVTPGNYAVTVQNDNGTSNALAFTVTSGTSNPPISINAIDAPPTLSVGATGTWTVRVTEGNSIIGNLHYSVRWGDENIGMAQGIMTPLPSPTQTSATFSHAYQTAGTYTPTFTVTDDNGDTATVNQTLTITPIY